jgi:nucleotide-binding universal stress UspA family protein
MRSILVFADRTSAMTPRLETALSLARSTGAHVTIVVDTPVSRYIAMDPMGGSYVASDALTDALARDDAHAAAIEEHLSSQDVPFDVVRCEDDPVEAVAGAARLADLVLVSHNCTFAGQLALTARCPVLVVRDGAALTFPLKSAVVAWDGGDEAALALRGAAPLLRSAGQVGVVTVDDKPGGFPATDALRYLARHGVSAELTTLTKQGSIEETIDRAARGAGADLLVMGAFGHSRMREFLFGGVTRYFLESADAPALLLAH